MIEKLINSSQYPVVLCSFGKDSLVLLDLVRNIKPNIDVLYFREPFYPKKYTHSEMVAKEWNLTVYDYPPTHTDYFQNEDWFDVCNYYYVNGKDWLNLFTGCSQPIGTEYLCAWNDLLNRPKVPSYTFKWDCILHGHRQQDNETENISKQIGMDKMFLKDFVLYENKKILALPLKDWTDKDIWDYIRENNLPYNKERYDNHNDDFNNDKFPTCFKCLDYRNQGKSVYCDKYKREMHFIGKSKAIQDRNMGNLMSNNYFKRGE
jgi:3'-phosphoadenosine 5'-phosphosulfate sulfotransferase (PAPS reductase)/FAD synthetase